MSNEDDELINEFLHKYTLSSRKKLSMPSTALPGTKTSRKKMIRDSKSRPTLKSSTRVFSDTREKNNFFLRPGSALPQNFGKKKRIASSMPYHKPRIKNRKSKKKMRPFTAMTIQQKKEQQISKVNPNLQSHFRNNFKGFKIWKKKKKKKKIVDGSLNEVSKLLSRNESKIKENLSKLNYKISKNKEEEEERRRKLLLKRQKKAKKEKESQDVKEKGYVVSTCQTNWEHIRDRIKENPIALLNEKVIYFDEMKKFMDKKFGKRLDRIDEMIEEMVKNTKIIF